MLKIKNVTEKELLELPICDLIRTPISEYRFLFRKNKLLDDEAMKALDHVLCLRVLLVLDKDDRGMIEKELDNLRRLVPHDRKEELDNRKQPWAAQREPPWVARIEMLGDMLGVTLGTELNRKQRLRNYKRLDKFRVITAS